MKCNASAYHRFNEQLKFHWFFVVEVSFMQKTHKCLIYLLLLKTYNMYMYHIEIQISFIYTIIALLIA